MGAGTGASCTEPALDACLPGGAAFNGTVAFDCGGAATITVTSTKSISADTTIDGGSLITVSGGNAVGVFFVNFGVKLTVQNLTIANGYGGNGGGIDSIGTLTVTNSTLSGNSAYYAGGGIFSNGPLTVVANSTFSGNSADFYGGGIENGSGPLTVTNSTFSGNSAGYGGGGISSVGPLTVSNSTFSGDSARYGAGMYNEGMLRVNNAILADSASGGNCAGSVTDGGHNIDDGATCGFTGTGCSSIAGNSFCNTNPGLDPAGLQNNGGPTQTIALQAGSPAVHAGNESACTQPPVNNLDQRGYARPGGGATHCSIGAYEYNSPGPPSCAGDCNGDHAVTLDEILTIVNIALGNTPVTTCRAGDANFDNQITVDEILAAANIVQNGCRPAATPTPNPAGADDCCQCPGMCSAPVAGTCGECTTVFEASCLGGALCTHHAPTPTSTATP